MGLLTTLEAYNLVSFIPCSVEQKEFWSINFIIHRKSQLSGFPLVNSFVLIYLGQSGTLVQKVQSQYTDRKLVVHDTL